MDMKTDDEKHADRLAQEFKRRGLKFKEVKVFHEPQVNDEKTSPKKRKLSVNQRSKKEVKKMACDFVCLYLCVCVPVCVRGWEGKKMDTAAHFPGKGWEH